MIEAIILPLIKIVIVLVAVLVTVMYIVLLERKVQAWVQVRLGPMRVGPHGILQPLADVLKLFVKEDITPAMADRAVFTAAPVIVLVPALIAFAVIPFSGDMRMFGLTIPGRIADVNVGLLYVLSVAGIGIYGIILGGWSSNSKYSLLGSLRSSAQLISYEIAVTMTLVTVIMLTGTKTSAGTLSLVGIVHAQADKGWWFGFLQPVAFFIYGVAALAETNRAPFDLPEAEQELVAGFHTEYSGMRFAFYFLAEYTNMIVVSAVATTLFLGGWLQPFPNVTALGFLGYVPGWAWFMLKTFGFLYVFLWVRATLPRYRYDQLMRLGWKWLIPLAIVNVVVTGLVKVLV
jgi:NADH-quinone oxidoreductase subunit H